MARRAHELMRVLQLNKAYLPHIGGVEQHVHTLSACLALLPDVECVWVLAANTRWAREERTDDGTRVVLMPSPGRAFSLPLTWGAAGWLRQASFDVIHLHMPSPTMELAYLRVRPPGRLVVTIHAPVIRQRIVWPLYRHVVDAVLDACQTIIVTSPQMQQHPILRAFRGKARVVPLGIPLEQFAPPRDLDTRVALLHQRYGGPFVLFVGRLVYYKGVDYLLQAMTGTTAPLVIVGDGPLRAHLQRLARGLRLDARIHFVGHLPQEDLVTHYHACAFLVLPSIQNTEAFGLVQVEAHACGRPVISTRLDTGVPFVNLDGLTGLVVPPRSADALAEAIRKLWEDEGLRRRLGEQAKARVHAEFSQAHMVERVMALYKELLF